MSINVSESQVRQVLSQIRHPEIPSRDLVSLELIPNVNIEADHVVVELALPFEDVPVKQTLVDLIENAVSGLEGNPDVTVEIVGMDEQQRNQYFALAAEAKMNPQPPEQVQKGGQVGKVLAVMSGKGGVGKSSVAALLASSLRRRGLKVGVLDADITGPSIPMMFGAHHRPEQSGEGLLPVESRTGVKLMSINLLLPDRDQPVVWRGPLISRAIEQFWQDIIWGDLDYLIVDLPPGTADAALTVMQSLPLDGIVLVTSPQDLAGMVVRKGANMAKNIGVPLVGIVENMSYVICPDCGNRIDVFGKSKTAKTANKIGTAMLGQIPLDTEFSSLCDRGAVEDYESDAFESIVDEVIDLVGDK